MRRMRWVVLSLVLASVVMLAGAMLARAEDGDAQKAAAAKTGFAVKKPVFGGACPTCPWGSIAEVVKKALKFYGWDVQICYYCAGGPREARLVAGAKMATPPQ